MRLCYVVQRYGAMIAGGAEQHCREMAERMAARGHDVEVVTTCAESYVDWANAFPAGHTEESGVAVHRLPVARPRNNLLFNELNRRMVTGHGARPLHVQREWMHMQGPDVPDLRWWLRRNASRFDCVICFTYLYATTRDALEAVRGVVPVVLHPTVHDEPPLRLSIFDAIFRSPDAFAFSTPEEIDLIRERFGFGPRGDVIGIGVQLPSPPELSFREAYGLGPAPFLLYVGRIDEGKGAGQLCDFFAAYKDRRPGSDLKLVFLGDPLMRVPVRDDIVVTGFVDYAVRDAAFADATVFVQPSFFESFSMVLTEAFAHGVPALVQGRCAVLRGHAARSGAAIPYEQFAEFDVALDMLLADPALVAEMGRAGRRYVEREYVWDVVLDRYETLIERTVERAGRSVP